MTKLELMELYGPRAVPSHDRDYPHICEIAVPFVIMDQIQLSKKQKSSDQSKKNVVEISDSPFPAEFSNEKVFKDGRLEANISAIAEAGSDYQGESDDNIDVFAAGSHYITPKKDGNLTDKAGNKKIWGAQLGQLVCAMEIPWIRDIIIDIWRYEDRLWATTSIGKYICIMIKHYFLFNLSINQLSIFSISPFRLYNLISLLLFFISFSSS